MVGREFKLIKRLLWCFILSLIIPFSFAKITILNYQPTFIPGFDKQGNLLLVIRTFQKQDGNKSDLYFLAVNPYTFNTSELLAADFKARKITKSNGSTPGYFTFSQINHTPYYKDLIKYTSAPYKLQNHGIIHSQTKINGNFLTIDMCPSIKPFESEFFKELIALSDIAHSPIPIGISISGLFIVAHQSEFNWLIQQQQQNKLNITWINHSFSHAYYRDLPWQENFLLFPQTNQDHEILQTEQLLLENGQLPSVFFRLPGLISNKQLILKMRKFGLIPIGSDAWLAKGQQIKPGSIILVHGNSNEHKGIELILPRLKGLNLLPLSKLFKN